MRSRNAGKPACKVYPFFPSWMTRTASRRITSGVGRSGSPRPRLILPGFARSEIFRIMLFSIPRRNGGGWNWFDGKSAYQSEFNAMRNIIERVPDKTHLIPLERSRGTNTHRVFAYAHL